VEGQSVLRVEERMTTTVLFLVRMARAELDAIRRELKRFVHWLDLRQGDTGRISIACTAFPRYCVKCQHATSEAMPRGSCSR
jgi:hypothetical protein